MVTISDDKISLNDVHIFCFRNCENSLLLSQNNSITNRTYHMLTCEYFSFFNYKSDLNWSGMWKTVASIDFGGFLWERIL